MRAAIVVALLLASAAHAGDGRYPLSGVGPPPADAVEDPWTRCSALPDPAFTPVAVTNASDLHTVAMANCSAGCILELAAGTYNNTNVVFGDTSIKASSITPTGEVLIRGADPANPPLLRAQLNVKAAVIHNNSIVSGIGPMMRVEDVILDGRRSEQTVAGITTVCTDTTPADGVCDGNQSSTNLHGFDTRNTSTGTTRSCLLRVESRETVGTAFQMTDAFVSTIEDSFVNGAGCTTALCPLLSIPANRDSTAVLKTAQGIQFVGGSDSAAIDNTVSGALKIGIECFTNARRCHIHGNTVTDAGIAGIILNEADGTVVGNTIIDIGFLFSPNAPSNNVGQGIQFTNGDTYAGLVAKIEGNSISNTFGSGIQIGLAGTAYNTARIEVARNSVDGTCNGGTRADSAAIELGDSTYVIAQIRSESNSISNDSCVDGMRVRNVRTFRAVGEGITNGIEADDVDEFEARSLSIAGNLDIDSDTKGKIRTCSLTGTVVGSTNVQRQDCGDDPAPAGSSLWDTMVWGTDVWGS